MTENGNVHAIQMHPTDAQIAADMKEQARKKALELCAIMEFARSNGMRLTFQVGMDGFGRYVVQSIDVVKVL